MAMTPTELAARCESAKADEQRELIELAFRLIHGEKPERIPGGSPEWLAWLDKHNLIVDMLDAHAYESAVIMLVPKGYYSWAITGRNSATIGPKDGSPAPIEWVFASTSALALLAARLQTEK